MFLRLICWLILGHIWKVEATTLKRAVNLAGQLPTAHHADVIEEQSRMIATAAEQSVTISRRCRFCNKLHYTTMLGEPSFEDFVEESLDERLLQK